MSNNKLCNFPTTITIDEEKYNFSDLVINLFQNVENLIKKIEYIQEDLDLVKIALEIYRYKEED